MQQWARENKNTNMNEDQAHAPIPNATVKNKIIICAEFINTAVVINTACPRKATVFRIRRT